MPGSGLSRQRSYLPIHRYEFLLSTREYQASSTHLTAINSEQNLARRRLLFLSVLEYFAFPDLR